MNESKCIRALGHTTLSERASGFGEQFGCAPRQGVDLAAEGQGYQAHRYRGPRPAHAEGAEVSAQEIEDLYIRDPWYFTEKREKEEKNNLLTDLLTNLLTHLRTNLLTNLLTNLRFNFDFLWAEYIFWVWPALG